MIPRGEFEGLAGPEFRRWLVQMERLGGCSNPVYLMGHTLTWEKSTGEVLNLFASASEPYGRHAVACRNRRESVCPSCAYLHHGDTYQLVVAGLAGGKGVPVDVAAHPRVFVTLTAPSFGAVHRVAAGDPAERCHPRRGVGACPHGVSEACYARHAVSDSVVGVPLCPACYDYAGAILWNAMLGRLWDRFVVQVRRELAKSQHIRINELPGHVRVSFAKVVEYQHRGSLHVHAVVRCDGPGGPADPPPGWATARLLGEAVSTAGAWASVRVPDPADLDRERSLSFGAQLDVQEISSGGALDGLTDQAVAAYIAKYVTKGEPPGLVLAHRLSWPGEIASAEGLSDHARRLMATAWRLGGVPQYAGLRLRLWAHQLGLRGAVASKSRLHSTTYKELRAVRSNFHRRVQFDPQTTETRRAWRYVGRGHSPGQAALALGIAEGVQDARAARRSASRRD